MKKSWYDGSFPHKNNEPTVDNCINCRFSYGLNGKKAGHFSTQVGVVTPKKNWL